MATKNNNVKDLTPATLEQMPVGKKINEYESILKKQSLLQDKLFAKKKEIEEAVAPSGKSFSEYHQQHDLRVFKKREGDPKVAAFATRFGSSLAEILANGTASEHSLESYLGKDAYAKLKAIADEFSIMQYGEKNVDESATDMVWQVYSRLIKEYRGLKEQLEKANREMQQADQYVTYVQRLAEVANKTQKLMLKTPLK